jgi:hypothetical protein
MEEEKETKEENIYDKLCEEVEKSIKNLLDNEGVTKENTETFGELVDIYKDLENVDYWKRKENMNMYGNYGNNYGNYGRGGSYGEYGRGSYGNYGEGSYGRRGRDARYRGDDEMDRMSEHYGRYEESRRYGANEDSKRSLKYMLESMENFAKYLKEDAQSPEEVMMIKETAQRIAQM